METTFRIGTLTVRHGVVVAPMAGYTDLPYRLIVKELGGTGLAYTELISCHALVHVNPNVLPLIATTPTDHPLGMQLFGADPQLMAAGASALEDYGADLIDLNMGCPVSKVVKAGGGAVLIAACGSDQGGGGGSTSPSGTPTASKTYKIGITQIATHPALDAAVKGFKKSMGEGDAEESFGQIKHQGADADFPESTASKSRTEQKSADRDA